eukprot:gene27335-33020_t
MGGLIAFLLLVALLGGFASYRSLKKERDLAQKEARETWLNQGEKNPHSAAHYGSFAFRPKSEMSFFDFGVDSFTGTNVYLEAHRQNDPKFSAAQDSSSLIRFGEMTVAFVLQMLVPLLIIFLCFNSISQEKEDNTLKLMLSQGVSMSQIAWGKIQGIWVLACVILPKATTNIGASIFKAPSNFEFREAIHKDEENGIDGHNPSDKRFEALKKQVLTQYKVNSVEQLPVNFDAIAMQEGEKYSTMVYNKHFDRMENIYQNQNSVAAYSAILNPFMAVRNLSMGMAGSDYKTALAFQKYAEKYRYEMVETLNTHMRDFSKTGDWEKKADASIYAKIPDFDFKNPSTISVLSQNWVAILALLLWIILCIRMVSNLKNISLS